MKKSFKTLAATLALLTTAGVAHAGSLAIINDGSTLSPFEAATFDWNVGNALAYNALPLTDGSAFTLYYQASLANFNDANGNAIVGTGLGSAYELTIVSAFGEKATLTNGGLTANFSLDAANTNNYIYIYKDSLRNSNNLTGTGFTDGDLILRARVKDLTSSNFNTSTTAAGGIATGNLDSFGPDNWSGQQTVKGSGATDLSAAIDWYDPSFFTNSIADNNLLISLFFNTSNVLPFSQTNPSHNFNQWNGVDAINPTYTAYTPDLGALNGITGPDMIFQADANQSFETVPEPSTMVLTGLGLLVAGYYRRRMKK